MVFIDRFIAFLSRLFRWDAQLPSAPVQESQDPVLPVQQPLPPPNPIPMPEEPVPNLIETLTPWISPKNNYHNTRVLCDQAGLTVDQKNLICACIFQESRFNIDAINHNKDSQGNILSTDYSLIQVNDFYHIGMGKDFPNVAYVLANPDKQVEWMIHMYEIGLLKQWVSFSSGAYKQWLLPSSPMWLLKT